MQFSSSLLAALALVLLQPARPQDTGAPPSSGEKPGLARQWPWGNASAADKLRQDLLGTWQLQRAQLSTQAYEGRDCGGYMLVLPEYLSMHTGFSRLNNKDPRPKPPTFASGTHRWTYDEGRLLLVMSALVAVNDMNDAARLEYEPAGTQREYAVDLAGDDLTLTRAGAVRLDFRRVGPATFPEPPRKSGPGTGKPAR